MTSIEKVFFGWELMDRTQAGVPGVSRAMHHLRVSQGFALLCGKRLFAYRFLNDAVHSPSPVLVPYLQWWRMDCGWDG